MLDHGAERHDREGKGVPQENETVTGHAGPRQHRVLNARADNGCWTIDISEQTRAMLRRPLRSAAGICDGWIKAVRKPHHTHMHPHGALMMTKFNISGLTSCSHQAFLGRDRRRSSGG